MMYDVKQMEQYVEHLKVNGFGEPFQPEFENPSDPPDSKFVITKPGVPYEMAIHPGEAEFECYRVGDKEKTKRFFRYVNSQWIESAPETAEEEIERLKAEARDFTYHPVRAKPKVAARAPASTPFPSPAPATAAAPADADGDDDSDTLMRPARPVMSTGESTIDRWHLNLRVQNKPLTELLGSARATANAKRNVVRIRSVLLNMVHLLCNGTRRATFPKELFLNAALDDSLLDEYHLMETNPAFLLGVIKGAALMVPKDKLDGLSVILHSAFDEKSSQKERLLCARLIEHLKRSTLRQRHHATIPANTKVADSVQPPAPAPAAAAGAGSASAAAAAAAPTPAPAPAAPAAAPAAAPG